MDEILAQRIGGQAASRPSYMPGRIFYETHIAPLLRMQGFFEEVALDFVTKSDDRIPGDRNVDLKPILHQVVEELRIATPTHVFEEHFTLTETVTCDKSRIGQLASNLIGNAVTHGSG